VLDESPSTNAVVAQRARAGEREGLVVTAEHQTAGRGRLGRTWSTPDRAALTFSVLLVPVDLAPPRWQWLPLLAGVAVADGVRRAGIEPTLKWPNDVLVDGRKVAGVLLERVERPVPRGGPAAVVGVGLNVSTTREELPVPSATSLALEDASSLERSTLLGSILGSLWSLYQPWLAAAGDPAAGLMETYSSLCSTIGASVRVDLPGDRSLHGQALGVDDGGRLRLSTEAGPMVLGAGDVTHVGVS
jgi:BirA family biotin operon repressor/biotin-[acetyl-CoA-carboxylase] ligase